VWLSGVRCRLLAYGPADATAIVASAAAAAAVDYSILSSIGGVCFTDIECPTGCATCSSSSVCTSCKTGYAKKPDSSACLREFSSSVHLFLLRRCCFPALS